MQTFDVEITDLSPGSGPAAYRDPGCPERLLVSLREQGQIQPLLVAERPTRLVLASGHRRCQGLLSLGQHRVTVRTVHAPRDLDVLRVSVIENSTGGGFNDLERARILCQLVDGCSVDAHTVATDWMPWLGLEPSQKLMAAYTFFGREDILHAGLRSGDITIGLAKVLSRFDQFELPSVVGLLSRRGLSLSKKRELLYLLDELKRRDDVSLSQLIDGEQGHTLLKFLRQTRYPQEMERDRQLKKVAQSLPSCFTIRATPAEGLEVKIVFCGIEELRGRLMKLLKISEDPKITNIIEKF